MREPFTFAAVLLGCQGPRGLSRGSRPGPAPGSARTAPPGRALLAHPAVRALPFAPLTDAERGHP